MNKETFRTDYGLLNRIHDDDPNFGSSGALGFGTGGIGAVRQDIGHAIRPGFGRNVGTFRSRSVRRKFNRHFQRGNYTGHGYDYECGLPASYYPSTHVTGWHPYSYHFDPYPYHGFQHDNSLNSRNSFEIDNTTTSNNKNLIVLILLSFVVYKLFL